jgi:hypothetical protein
LELLFVERSVVVRNRGSVEFSPTELASDIVLVDIKCDAIGGTIYVNNKTLPPYGFFGSVTLFGGATVRERISLEFPYQRVLDFESLYRRLRCYLTRISIRQEAKEGPSPNNYFTPLGDAILPDSFEYRGLPYSKIKLNSERLAQYTVTVRSYTEDTGFACQSQNKPDDPTKGEPEYPSPLAIPPGGQFPATLPNPTAPYSGADPNDFDPTNPQDWTPKTVYFGLRGMFTTGEVGGPNNCTADAPFNSNKIWENAGPPPYTAVLGDTISPSCTNSRFGFHVVASDGTRSPLYSGSAGTLAVEIVVFQFTPFA